MGWGLTSSSVRRANAYGLCISLAGPWTAAAGRLIGGSMSEVVCPYAWI